MISNEEIDLNLQHDKDHLLSDLIDYLVDKNETKLDGIMIKYSQLINYLRLNKVINGMKR